MAVFFHKLPVTRALEFSRRLRISRAGRSV